MRTAAIAVLLTGCAVVHERTGAQDAFVAAVDAGAPRDASDSGPWYVTDTTGLSVALGCDTAGTCFPRDPGPGDFAIECGDGRSVNRLDGHRILQLCATCQDRDGWSGSFVWCRPTTCADEADCVRLDAEVAGPMHCVHGLCQRPDVAVTFPDVVGLCAAADARPPSWQSFVDDYESYVGPLVRASATCSRDAGVCEVPPECHPL